MEQIKLSKRLHTVAHLIKSNRVVADIGTDHGYLPIYIVKNQIAKRVIAMDVRKGPLEKASQNVKAYEVSDAIDLRLSDGLEKLQPLEADTVTICGMGGKLIQSILTKGITKIDEYTQLIVSPQSEISEFRRFLNQNGFLVEKELMLQEDNQFYLIIECRLNHKINQSSELIGMDSQEQQINTAEYSKEDVTQQMFLRYGRTLLEKKDETLYEYLLHEQRINDKVCKKLEAIEEKDSAICRRLQDITFDRKCIEEALNYYQL